MRKMLNTLYITSEDAYLALNGETVEILFSDSEKKRIPLHTLENIISFSYKGASPALMGKCEEKGIGLCFFSPNGKYLASVGAAIRGNVLLRKTQYRQSENKQESLRIARNIISAKLYNSEQILLRSTRDHPFQVDVERIITAAKRIEDYLGQVRIADNDESLLGLEGLAAAEYYSVFDELILQQKDIYKYTNRSRRPPMDRVNALLSFSYVLLASMCESALLSVGIDPYVGFLHKDRPGRKSLALDLMEDLRSVFADRFVLSLINNKVIKENDFTVQESGAVLLNDKGKRVFLSKWQEKKRTEIVHPFLKEKIPWGMVPYAQAMLLARYLRGDIDQYPPLFWR